VNVVHIVIALGTISAAYSRVLYFEPQSSRAAANAVLCPDGGRCADNDTCCMLESLAYGCCPYPMVSAARVIVSVFIFCDNRLISLINYEKMNIHQLFDYLVSDF